MVGGIPAATHKAIKNNIITISWLQLLPILPDYNY